ncbi:unnamed protein product [Peronospora belbahrii]|uniref:Reverse transcriptase domain-containing protein n=1 Tax=Peronospora belbahrii TaxID=622444 RepID=A0AAU9KRR1_9STRA|nr:unnamed protein product [Peronospora belbahrii]
MRSFTVHNHLSRLWKRSLSRYVRNGIPTTPWTIGQFPVANGIQGNCEGLGDAYAAVSVSCHRFFSTRICSRTTNAKTVSMMLAHLQRVREESTLNADASRAIVLLDFREAYDTVDRDFIVEAVRLFGFSENFLALIQRLHTNTTARYSVNGELSSLRTSRCRPLQYKRRHIFPGSHFPENTQKPIYIRGLSTTLTLFLQQASLLRSAMDIVLEFGRLSGLQMQTTKSQIIFLNTAIRQLTYQGIAVVAPSTTTRYLGYQVGTGKLRSINSSLCFKKAQRRLLTATRASTTLEHRILILNAIVLPGILFTAVVFEPQLGAHTAGSSLQTIPVDEVQQDRSRETQSRPRPPLFPVRQAALASFRSQSPSKPSGYYTRYWHLLGRRKFSLQRGCPGLRMVQT